MVAHLKGNTVWDAFKNEAGPAAVQRIPPTETKGRKQTSFVSVVVLPVRQDIKLDIQENDIKVEAICLAVGPGGQHMQKTASACRMTYLPTNLIVTINSRDFHSNKREARKILESKLYQQRKETADANYNEMKRAQFHAGRGYKVRTYNFLDGRAVDHRNGKKSNVKEVIGKGRFEKLL